MSTLDRAQQARTVTATQATAPAAAEPAPPAPGRARFFLCRTVAGTEWRLQRRDAGLWLAVALLMLCSLYAMWGGLQREHERASAVHAAQLDERARLAQWQQQIAQLSASGAERPSQVWRDPASPIGTGRGAAATVAHLAPAPLALTAAGLSDLHPPSVRIGLGSRDRFFFVDELANPMVLASGPFDLAFVVVYLLPLLVLGLNYNLWSQEREQGTWALIAASSAPPLAVLLVKGLVRIVPLLLVLLATPLVAWSLAAGALSPAEAGSATARGIDAAGFGAAALLPWLAWALSVTLYALLWLALALWVNSWRKDSASNAVMLVTAWVALLVIVPAGINAGAQAAAPAPSRAELLLTVRQGAIDAERDREAAQAGFRADHGASPAQDSAATRDRRLAAQTRRADAQAREVMERHDAQVLRQRRLSDALSALAPPMLMQNALADLAGHGHARWDTHLAELGRFHERWQQHFLGLAEGEIALTAASAAAFPRFQAQAQPTFVSGVARRLLTTWAWMASLCALALSRAVRGFSQVARG
ncbi:MAG: DUF3526 domain-containing protein [Rubrivivax sp.]|nr:DUF3526 domain-containing protein [Rubrivivax sp.]